MIVTKTFSFPCFRLNQIARSGQCFRMLPLETGGYSVISSGRYLEVREDLSTKPNKEAAVSFTCEEKDLDFWLHYFDLDTDYQIFLDSIRSEDSYLRTAGTVGYGIRILRQDLWEMIITFILSQQKTIPAIRQAVELLSLRYGTPIKSFESDESPEASLSVRQACPTVYAFPTPEQLSQASLEDLQSLKLGYRAKYIVKITQDVCTGAFDLPLLLSMDYSHSLDYVKQFYGIGEKVANCICLFGLHHIDAFPVDTWIQKILMAEYFPRHPRRYKKLPKSRLYEAIIADHFSCYQGYAGVMQQYIFYYERERMGKAGQP